MKKQIILTTHSTMFTGFQNELRCYRVTHDGKETKIHPLTKGEGEAEILNDLGLPLSSVYMHERLLFLEGPSDIVTFRVFAKKLGLCLDSYNVGVIPMGGARSIMNWANANIISELSKQKVKVHIVIDRDEKTEEDITRLQQEADEHANVSIHVLQKRELENYLLDADAIRELLSKERNKNIDRKEIELAIANEIESLKHFTLYKRLMHELTCRRKSNKRNPTHFNTQQDVKKHIREFHTERKSQLLDDGKIIKKCLSKEAFNEYIHKFEGIWEEKKVDIVPGEELLQRVFAALSEKHFLKKKIAFKKNKHCATIAGYMGKEDIPREIEDIIRSIVEKR